ncbi:MAG: hypothetical protein JNM09_18585 [Blastocatellia bacterium]|nr:hypothetical protein [Blastocatellia bacterium]
MAIWFGAFHQYSVETTNEGTCYEFIANLIRLCFGYFLAPLTTPLTFLLFGWLWSGAKVMMQMGAFILFATPAACLIAFLFGIALVIFLGTRGKTSWWMFALGGFFVGVIPG